MSLNSQQLVERALRRLSPQDDLVSARSRLLVLIPDALKSLAESVSDDENERVRNQLRKDFTLTVTSGVASLTTPLTATEPLLDHTLDKAFITSTDSSHVWQYMDYSLLTLERPAFGLIYYGVKGTNLYATDSTGTLGSLTTTATANCSFIPLLTTVSGNLDLEEQLVSILAEMSATGEVEKAA